MKINKIKIAAKYIAQNTTLFGSLEGRRLPLGRSQERGVRKLGCQESGLLCWAAEKQG